MTIDLDELERKARARASDDEWDESSLRREWGEHIAPPDVVIALIERIRDAERRLAKMCDLHMDEKRRRMAAEEQASPSRVMSLDAPTNSGCTCQGLSFYSPACHPACPAAKAKP